MIRRALVLPAALLAFAIPAAASDPAAAFRAFVERAVKYSETPEGARYLPNAKGPDKWSRAEYTIVDLRFDVRKTDSLLNPLIAHAHFWVGTRHTELQPTRAAAEAAPLGKPNVLWRYELNYQLAGDKWQLRESRYGIAFPPERHPRYGGWNRTDADRILRRESAVSSVLLHWIGDW